MPEHANEALPRLAFFIPQCAAQVAKHNKLMRQTTLPERPAPHAPAARCAGESELHGSRGFSAETPCEPQFQGRGTQQAFQWARQQALAGAVYQPELGFMVERKDGQIDFFDD